MHKGPRGLRVDSGQSGKWFAFFFAVAEKRDAKNDLLR